MVAKLKLKGIDGREPPGVEPAEGLTDCELFVDLVGAWLFVVGGVFCLVNSYNPALLRVKFFLEGLA